MAASPTSAPPADTARPTGQLPEGALPLTGWRQTFSSLSGNPDFAMLYAGNVAFFFGMSIMMILRGWLVIERWDNAAYLGYIMATVALPTIVLAPVGGVVSDRVDKRLLIMSAQALLVVTNAIVAVLVVADAIEFWHLLAVSAVSGVAFSFTFPGRQALVATLVPRHQMMNAIALSTAAMNASRVIAPPLGGVLIVLIGIGPAFVVATLFYAVAVVATFALPPMPPARGREFTFFEDFFGGFTYIKRAPLLGGLLLFGIVPMVFAVPYQTLLPVFADRVWHVGELGFGLLQGASGVGGLIGALIVANLDAYPKKLRLMVGGSFAVGGFLVLFALAPSFYLALFAIAAVGFGSMVVMTVNNTAIQLITPDEVRGRVMSVMMLSFGLMPLGAVPAGVAAESVGVQPVVAVGAALFVLASLVIVFAVPALRLLDGRLEASQERGASGRVLEASAPAAAVAPEAR